MRFRVHLACPAVGGGFVPACRKETRDDEVFKLTADRTKVTCAKCVTELAKHFIDDSQLELEQLRSSHR